MMPYKSGLKLQHIVSKYPNIPVIIVSALEILLLRVQTQGRRFISKPFNTIELTLKWRFLL
jgi:DNA-binding response OmpR family regulator